MRLHVVHCGSCNRKKTYPGSFQSPAYNHHIIKLMYFLAKFERKFFDNAVIIL